MGGGRGGSRVHVAVVVSSDRFPAPEAAVDFSSVLATWIFIAETGSCVYHLRANYERNAHRREDGALCIHYCYRRFEMRNMRAV